MKTYLIDLEEAVAYLARENPAQEHAPLAGHQKSRTPAAAPVQEQNRTELQPIRNRSWGMRAGSALWAALAIALSLFASPLRAQFVYVANQGSGNVSGYTIEPSTGALTPIANSPFAGFNSVSVAVGPRGKFAYVANQGSSPDFSGTVLGYKIDPSTGALTPIAGSPFPANALPFSVTVDPNGKFAYVANFDSNTGSSTVSGYTIEPCTGALTATAGSPFPAGRGFPLGFPATASVAVDPTGRFANPPGSGNVSGYKINRSTGALTSIAGSPFHAGTRPISVAIMRQL
jgi:6-phosphogluconolactonase